MSNNGKMISKWVAVMIFLIGAIFSSNMVTADVDENRYEIFIEDERSTVVAVRTTLLQVLQGRGWGISKIEKNIIQTSLDHRNVEAKLEIKFDEKKVTIISDSYRNYNSQAMSGSKRKFFPKNWIINIDRDLKRALPNYFILQSVNDDEESEVAGNAREIKGKLKLLKELHGQRLITDETFETKQAELLSQM